MKITKNGFYTLKTDFIKKVKDSNIPQKDKRPVYYCIEDKKNKEIFWVIPMTSQVTKAMKFIEKCKPKECYNFEINTTMPNSVFNIQDVFPVTKKYIDSEYLIDNEPYKIKDKKLIKSIEKKAMRFISLGMMGKNKMPTSINIVKIKNLLEEELTKDKEELKELIKKISNKELPRGNYNALTGNEIITLDHASGDKRWLTLEDVRRNNILIKENEQPILSIITHQEEEKLYAKPIEYYNVSQLEITKEIEQQFKPLKEKVVEKSQEKEQGIGD